MRKLQALLNYLTPYDWYYVDKQTVPKIGQYVLTNSGNPEKERVGRVRGYFGNQVVIQLGHFRGEEWIASTSEIKRHINLCLVIDQRLAAHNLQIINRRK